MTEFSTAIELVEAQDLQIDTSSIDVSEVESAEDQEFLRQHGAEILRIDAKANAAIKQIVATIQGRASLAKGKEIAAIQDRFEGRRTGELKKFYKSLNLSYKAASHWASAYRAYSEFGSLFDGLIDPAKVLECSDHALARIQTLPAEYRQQVLADVATGDVPTEKEVAQLADKPEVKLSKAEELLAAAKARKAAAEERWEEVKADPNIPYQVDGVKNPEYFAASKAVGAAANSVANFEQQIADLKAQIEEEKLKTAKEHEAKAKLETQIQQLKFDDATVRAERVKRVSNTLIVSLPQALSDLRIFQAELAAYPEDRREHIINLAKEIGDYCGDLLNASSSK